MPGAQAPRMVTVVVGAGPAGLLFAIVSRILAERAGVAEAWSLRLLDKRASYGRSHRLRMDRAAYLVLGEMLADPRFDALLAFLEEARFAPEVNRLEEQLGALARDLGVEKQLATVGDGAGEVTLAALREQLEREGALPPLAMLTVVGADSVHSAVRRMATGGAPPARQKHEQLARLRVDGAGLPEQLGPADQVRISKLLGSLVDYRRNRNGFAEVDLFLTDAEHARVRALGASPASPVVLDEGALRGLGAPLFTGIVRHLGHGPDGAPREVRLTSTFALEHAVAPRRVLPVAAGDLVVLLVGDAAASLPFQRGMSCLARCVSALAEVHLAALHDAEAEAALGSAPPQVGAAAAVRFEAYDAAVDAIVLDELSVVRWRAALVRALREGVRLASLAPFPIQSWWLSPPGGSGAPERASRWHALNVGVAVATGVIALGGSFLRVSGWPWGPHAAWFAIFLEALGGALYRASLAMRPEPQPRLRRIWQAQLMVVFLGGVAITVVASLRGGELTHPFAAFWSLRLAAAFLVGLYLFEAVSGRVVRAAALGDGRSG